MWFKRTNTSWATAEEFLKNYRIKSSLWVFKKVLLGFKLPVVARMQKVQVKESELGLKACRAGKNSASLFLSLWPFHFSLTFIWTSRFFSMQKCDGSQREVSEYSVKTRFAGVQRRLRAKAVWVFLPRGETLQ